MKYFLRVIGAMGCILNIMIVGAFLFPLITLFCGLEKGNKFMDRIVLSWLEL